MGLTRTVTTQQPVDGRIADLVYFVKNLERRGVIKFVTDTTDHQLIAEADMFWDTQHGEDD